MKVIIAGSRTMFSVGVVRQAVEDSGLAVTRVLSGCAAGIDAAGEGWAADNGIPVDQYPADWRRHGRAAGPIRNREMARDADALVAIWDGRSRGTKNMIDEANRQGLLVHVHKTVPVEAEQPIRHADDAGVWG